MKHAYTVVGFAVLIVLVEANQIRLMMIDDI